MRRLRNRKQYNPGNRLTEAQRLAVISWIKEGLDPTAIQSRAIAFTPPFVVNAQQYRYYRDNYTDHLITHIAELLDKRQAPRYDPVPGDPDHEPTEPRYNGP